MGRASMDVPAYARSRDGEEHVRWFRLSALVRLSGTAGCSTAALTAHKLMARKADEPPLPIFRASDAWPVVAYPSYPTTA